MSATEQLLAQPVGQPSSGSPVSLVSLPNTRVRLRKDLPRRWPSSGPTLLTEVVQVPFGDSRVGLFGAVNVHRDMIISGFRIWIRDSASGSVLFHAPLH
jgi:hypothetical protein